MTRPALLSFSQTLFLISSLCFTSLTLTAQEGVHAVLPDGREIRPAGNWIATFPFPFGLNIISHPDSATPDQRRLPATREQMDAVEAHSGVAYSADGKTLYVASGNSGRITLYDTTIWKPTTHISLDGLLNGTSYEKSFAATVLVSKDGRTLYALDQANWRIVIIDAANRNLLACVSTGRYPFDIALSPDGNRLYVSNIGIFEYKL